MSRLGYIALATVIVSLTVCVVIHRRGHDRELAGVERLQQQSDQLAALTAEHERLSQRVARTNNVRPDDHAAEMAKLRAQAEALRKQTNELAQLAGQNRKSNPSATTTPTVPDDPAAMMLKASHGRDLGYAFWQYADEHKNQAPTDVAQLTPYLLQEHREPLDPGDFEIIYHGSLDDLQGIPPGSVMVVRSRQVWQRNGRLVRIYGALDGHGEQIGSDDNFQSYEADHVISPP